MATVILESTQTETPDNKILDKDWAGEFQLYCKTASTTPVKLQIREQGGTWQNAIFNGTEIELKNAGAVLDIKIAREFEYRLATDTAGAEVLIARTSD